MSHVVNSNCSELSLKKLYSKSKELTLNSDLFGIKYIELSFISYNIIYPFTFGTLKSIDNMTTGAMYINTRRHGFPDSTLFRYSTGLQTALYLSSARTTVMYVDAHNTML